MDDVRPRCTPHAATEAMAIGRAAARSLCATATNAAAAPVSHVVCSHHAETAIRGWKQLLSSYY